MNKMKVLVLNCGSTSVKFKLFDMAGACAASAAAERPAEGSGGASTAAERPAEGSGGASTAAGAEAGEASTAVKLLAKGAVDSIGEGGAGGHLSFKTFTGEGSVEEDREFADHSEAIKVLLEKLTSDEAGVLGSLTEIRAVGHRVVHGGERFKDSVLIDDDVLADIDACSEFAPLHNPAALAGIRACQALLGDVPEVAVFDTSFHAAMPEKAFLYALPYEYYTEHKVRRYGFHGISHRYVTARAAEILGAPLSELKLISCHLGGGSSVCAVAGGRSVDTTMGFTPLSGVPMGSRCGDLDPSILEYIANKTSAPLSSIISSLNTESGLLGISGRSSDYRVINAAASDGDSRARLALEVFHYSVAKSIGAYAAAMNGVDGIIFTAGIGENSASARAAICSYLTYLGVELIPDQNPSYSEGTIISTPESRVPVLVIPTNEELVIAQDTVATITC